MQSPLRRCLLAARDGRLRARVSLAGSFDVHEVAPPLVEHSPEQREWILAPNITPAVLQRATRDGLVAQASRPDEERWVLYALTDRGRLLLGD